MIQSRTGHSTDILFRQFPVPTGRGTSFAVTVVYLEGMADATPILDALLFDSKENHALEQRLADHEDPLTALIHSVLKIGDIQQISDMDSVYHAILSGDTVVLVEGVARAIAAGTKHWKDRGVTEPSTQTVIRGPREGFSETLRTNTMLIRRKIKNPGLWLETMQIGVVTQTDVSIMYIDGIVNPKVVAEVRQRLNKINIDAILESAYVEEWVQDSTATPFPTVYNTERPDVVAAGLLEGRVAILVDGTPFVLLVPALFTNFVQTAEDYYQRADISSLLRMLRYVCLMISMLAPSAYIAATTFHQEMIPTSLLTSIAAQREGIPFPAFVEAMLMEITFEILREAGVRMPRAIGQAVSIVGALVIGQAAVEAGLVGPAMVIIVSITAISNFVIPSFSMGIAIRMIRFLLMVLAATFGLFGIMVGLIALVLHLCSLRSFGVPYMAPFAPFIIEDQKDNLFRLPLWMQHTRPRLVNQSNMVREQASSNENPLRKN
nr:spore germination protein [Paenibacillus rigui]